MKIVAFQKLTLLDYPEHIATTIFLAGCNLKCPFCHNIDLVYDIDTLKSIDETELFDYLTERKGKIEGVCITGGEPLINNDIFDLIYNLKDMGYLIKLDTNGYYPEKLKKILDEKLVDYIAMDIKIGKSKYAKLVKNDSSDYLKSIDLLIHSSICYEFRTTCVKGIHTESDFYEIREMIKGAKKYFLQDYSTNDKIEHLPYKAFTSEELLVFLNIVKSYVDYVDIRGI